MRKVFALYIIKSFGRQRMKASGPDHAAAERNDAAEDSSAGGWQNVVLQNKKRREDETDKKSLSKDCQSYQ